MESRGALSDIYQTSNRLHPVKEVGIILFQNEFKGRQHCEKKNKNKRDGKTTERGPENIHEEPQW